MQTLYKKSKTGAILQWDIKVDGNTYWTEHGQIDGKITIGVPTVCEAVNVGKSNEVSPEEQAKLVAQRKWEDRQKTAGYFTSIEAVDDGKSYFECTLAHKWTEKAAAKLPEHLMGSPKLDGLRCIITSNGAFTRNGKDYVTTKYIEESLVSFFEQYPDVVLDGELYCHSLHNDFNKITSLARKTKAKSIKEDEWAEIKDKLKLYIFDICDINEPEMTFVERYEFYQEHFKDHPYVVTVENEMLTRDEISEYHAKCIEEGYEGIMLRDPFMEYEHTRSRNLLKYKEFTDDEFEVIDITAGKGIRATMAGRIHCVTQDGIEFDASMRGTHEYATELLERKEEYVGKKATIRYQNLTPDGKPRFGVMVDINRHDI